MKANELEKKIIDFLAKHPKGLTISDIAISLDSHRHTISKYVSVLEALNIVEQREVGRAKLCVLKKRLSHA